MSGPGADATVVVIEASRDVVAQTDVEAALGIFDDVYDVRHKKPGYLR
jgi:hypothetical protein